VLTTNIVYAVIYFIIALGILVFVHEFGHFLLAKKLGVGVLTFSLGFGRKLIGKKVGETEYKVSAIPLGGYVKLIGENPEEEVKKEDMERSFWVQPKWKRFLVVIAGSFFNFFLGIAIFCFVNPFAILSTTPPPILPVVTEITSGSPAEAAGMKKGDQVLSVDGEGVSTWEELSKIIRNSKGRELTIKIKRDGEVLEIRVTPITAQVGGEQVYRIGIVGPKVYPKIGPKLEMGNGVGRTWLIIKFTIIGIVKIFEGEIPAKDAVAGPLGIAQMAGQQARKGPVEFLYLIAVLSVSLGFFNLFPIPVLDGGHLLFIGLEAVFRKPLSIKKMEIAQQIGLIFIILLMLFAFYNDLIRIFSPGEFKF
jgi:regulator of sigma E protease